MTKHNSVIASLTTKVQHHCGLDDRSASSLNRHCEPVTGVAIPPMPLSPRNDRRVAERSRSTLQKIKNIHRETIMITQLTKQEIADRLESRKIRPSLQRMAVYDFLLKNPVHPSADDIYSSLSPSIPTLSKTTVYNTLKQFADAGLVTTITIEDGELRFDADTSDHIHFKCTECGKIFDIYENIEIDNDILPKGFRLTKSQMNLWGTCRECQPNR